MRWFVVLLLVASAALAWEYNGSSSTFTDVVQDATGTVWCNTDRIADERSTSGGNQLYATDGKSWRVVACPANAPAKGGYFSPGSLGKRRDGSVLCLWHTGEASWLISRHRGEESVAFARLEGITRTGSEFFEDSRGDIWLTGTGSRIGRIRPDGTAEVAFELNSAQYRARDEKNSYRESSVMALEDEQHRVWFWAMQDEAGRPGLRGVLIFDGKDFAYHPAFEGAPPGKLSLLANKDATHLWLHVAADGMYELDVRSLKARRVDDPELDAFKNVRQIFQADGTAWLVADPEAESWPRGSAIHWTQRRNILWRWDGVRWSRAITGLDDDVGMGSDRPWLVTEQGLWIGCIGSGPHLLPRDGGKSVPLDPGCDSIRLDWRFGIDIPKSSSLFKMPDGRMMIVATNAGVQFASLPLTANRQPEHVRIEHYRVPILQDARGVIWGLPTSGNGLRSKDSGPWRDHSLPRGLVPERVGALGLDDGQRVWLLPDDHDAETTIFDPARETWEVFANYEAALGAQLPHRAEFSLRAGRWTPAFSTDGRIAFANPSDKVHYFDGKGWSRAERIVKFDGGGSIRPQLMPFFNAVGRLAFNYPTITGRTTLELVETEGWRNVTYEPNPIEEAVNREPKVIPPPGCITAKPRHIVKDSTGTFWLTWRQMLYRAVSGVCVPVFKEGQPSPFFLPCWLREAFVANDGEVYLHTWSPEQYCVPLFSKPLPDTQVTVSKPIAGGVSLGFSTDAGDPHWFCWRLGDQPWSAPATSASVELHDLAAGTHRIEAVALDCWLRADPTPAVCTVEIAIDATRPLADLIAALGSVDFSVREQAVLSLKRRGPMVVPELKNALVRAPDDLRWWIEAAIQELHRR